MNKNYFFLIGTVAEFIKVFPVMVEMDKRGLSYKLISTGQNNIANVDLFNELKHRNIDCTFNTQPSQQTTLSLLSWWLKTFVLGISKLRHLKTNNDYLIIHGDTISTLMGALLGKITGFKIVHIESGLRSFNFLSPFPEEINRVIVSNMADIHFAPNSWAVGNLKRKRGLIINTQNNTLIDSLHLALKNTKAIPAKLPQKYFVFIFHRQENLADTNYVKNTVNQIIKQVNNLHCVFIVHGNTLHTLKALSLYEKIKSLKNITLLERISYFSFMKLLNKAEFLITDGGSNQEEAFYLGLPTLILRKYSERIEGLNSNVVLGGRDTLALSKFFSTYNRYQKPAQVIENSPSKIIVDILEKQK
jgi:UDP-N-acetylglucosamine 2-epimerase (non-hydrolysing)